MNYSKALKCAIKKQDLGLKVEETPFNIILKDTGDILTLCFLEQENKECLIVAETTTYGTEEIRIIPKGNIEYVSIFYESIIEEEEEDKMFT